MAQEEKRLFVGIPIDEVFIDEINGLYKLQAYDPKMRWTPFENLHITLVFKGKTEAFRINEIKSRLFEYLKEKPAFELNFDKFLVMPFDRPKMIWAQFEQHPIHAMLAKGIGEILRVKADKKTIPHITIARFKPEANYNELMLNRTVNNPTIRANKIHLYESVLHPSGPEYKILDTYFLS